MARPRVSDEQRSTPIMISLPRRLQDALRLLVQEAAARGQSTSVSGLIRELIEARLAAAPAGPAMAPSIPDHVWRDALTVSDPPVSDSSQSVLEQMQELLQKSPPRPPSQMTREEREEHMRRMDPEGYRKMREAYEASLSATGDD